MPCNTAAATCPPSQATSFSKFTVGTGGNILIKGSGIFKYVDIDAALIADLYVKYRNPATGVAYVDFDDADGDPAGYYDLVSTIEQEVAVVTGQVLEGDFTSSKACW